MRAHLRRYSSTVLGMAALSVVCCLGACGDNASGSLGVSQDVATLDVTTDTDVDPGLPPEIDVTSDAS